MILGRRSRWCLALFVVRAGRSSYNKGAMAQSRIHGLYVIIDPHACVGREAVDIARQALEGGASVIQWRDKRRDKGEQLADARAVHTLCTKHNACFIVNDHLDLALAADADGVHLGQHDLPLEAVRPLAPAGFIVGVSTNNVEEAQRAEAAGASYIAVGSIFPTDSKPITRPASPELLREIKDAIELPVVAIGGIHTSNVGQVRDAGADAAAVISAVCAATDPRAAAQKLASQLVE